jgi:hypothetical protein
MTTYLIPDVSEKRMQGAMQAYAMESLKAFREGIQHKDVPVHSYYTFILMPLKGSMNNSQLNKLVIGMKAASVTRNLQLLAGLSKTRQDQGFDLLIREIDSLDKRGANWSLSESGIKLRATMHERGFDVFKRMLDIKEVNDVPS